MSLLETGLQNLGKKIGMECGPVMYMELKSCKEVIKSLATEIKGNL